MGKSNTKLLDKSELKFTKHRKTVFEFLHKFVHPVSADFIRQKTKLDKVTIYRILELFEKNKIIFSEIFSDKKRYYIADKPHHHIVCQSCQKMSCVPCSHDLPKIKGFKNIKHNIYLTGICNNCQ